MARGAGLRAMPWARILVLARIVIARFSEDLPEQDRRRLGAILAATKGNPRRLTASQRTELLRILRQVDVVKLRNEVAAAVAAGKLQSR